MTFIAPPAGRVDINIAIALAPFLVVHRRRVTIVPSLAVKLPSRSRRPSPLCRALHHPLFAIAAHRRPSPLCSWSIAAALAPSLAVKEPSRRPSPSGSRCAIAVEEQSGAVGRVDRRLRPLVTPLPGLSSGWLSRCLSSLSHCGIAFCASHPSGWLSCLLASHAATSHLPAPPPLIAPSPLVTSLLLGLSSSWLRHRLSSRCHQKTVREC